MRRQHLSSSCLNFYLSFFDSMSLIKWFNNLTYTYTNVHTNTITNTWNILSHHTTILLDFLTFSFSFWAESRKVLLPTAANLFHCTYNESSLFYFMGPSILHIYSSFLLVSSFRDKLTLLWKADSVHIHVQESYVVLERNISWC